MERITNSLTNFLDQKLKTVQDVDSFIDNIEEEIFGIPVREFYSEYKGDIKELAASLENKIENISFEFELLNALNIYNIQKNKEA